MYNQKAVNLPWSVLGPMAIVQSRSFDCDEQYVMMEGSFEGEMIKNTEVPFH